MSSIGDQPNSSPLNERQQAWLQELAERPEISPDQLLELFTPEWVHEVDLHQRDMAQDSLQKLIEKPLPEAKDEAAQKLGASAINNTAFYDDHVEDLIYHDNLLKRLLDNRADYATNEAFSKLMRLRRTIVAHYLFSKAVANPDDLSLPTMEEVIEADERQAELERKKPA